ncbi:class I SAM-dependent methyltransferase [Bacillus spongiae]|uniref:Class I SAM-dependent methyltransferase n=1 Tax=Bacillus spongiae TaxID=2683610 RepID=A0ABU8HH45_9BACI
MSKFSYLDMLAQLGIGGAHPGGFSASKDILSSELLEPETRILDAGCGTGLTSYFLAEAFQCDTVGIDSNETMIEKAKTRIKQGHKLQFIQASVEDLPFEDNDFDIIVTESVLSFVDTLKAIKEFHRILKKDGVLLINEIVKNDKLSNEEEQHLKTFYGIKKLRNLKEWESLLLTSNFHQIEMTPIIIFNEGDVEEGVEFQLSETLHPDAFTKLDEHEQLQKKIRPYFNEMMIRCEKRSN